MHGLGSLLGGGSAAVRGEAGGRANGSAAGAGREAGPRPGAAGAVNKRAGPGGGRGAGRTGERGGVRGEGRLRLRRLPPPRGCVGPGAERPQRRRASGCRVPGNAARWSGAVREGRWAAALPVPGAEGVRGSGVRRPSPGPWGRSAAAAVPRPRGGRVRGPAGNGGGVPAAARAPRGWTRPVPRPSPRPCRGSGWGRPRRPSPRAVEQRGRADAPTGSGLGGIGSRSAGPPFRLPWRLTERSGARSPWPVARGGLPAIRALRQARQPCQPRGEGGRGGRVAVCLAVCLLTRAGAQGVLSVQPKIA